MTGRIVVDQPGAPEVMRWVDAPVAEPGPNEVRIRQEAVGVDFIDTQIRGGLMQVPLPTGLGMAAVGKVVAAGADVKHVKVGDRVGYLWTSFGSYAEERVVPADRVLPLPDQSLAPEAAAGALLRGLTAWYLVTRLKPIGKGDTALVHAAAGGVGTLLSQWLKHVGVTVVGTVGHADKVEVARAHGADHVVVLPDGDFAAKVKEVSNGVGAAIVYECIGKATYAKSLDAAKRFGLIASFGWPSGDPGPVSLMDLRTKGSLFITRPTVTQYTADPADYRAGFEAFFGLVRDGVLKITVGHSYPLKDAAKAHADLASGRTTGAVVLVP